MDGKERQTKKYTHTCTLSSLSQAWRDGASVKVPNASAMARWCMCREAALLCGPEVDEELAERRSLRGNRPGAHTAR